MHGSQAYSREIGLDQRFGEKVDEVNGIPELVYEGNLGRRLHFAFNPSVLNEVPRIRTSSKATILDLFAGAGGTVCKLAFMQLALGLPWQWRRLLVLFKFFPPTSTASFLDKLLLSFPNAEIKSIALYSVQCIIFTHHLPVKAFRPPIGMAVVMILRIMSWPCCS